MFDAYLWSAWHELTSDGGHAAAEAFFGEIGLFSAWALWRTVKDVRRYHWRRR